MQDQFMNGWTVLNALVLGLPATIAAITAAIRAGHNSTKIDTVGHKVNGRMSELMKRNRQLSALLSQHGIPFPAELTVKEDPDARHS